MPKLKQNKPKITVTLSKWVKVKAEECARSDEYGSFSNFVEIALIYYLGALEKEKELQERNTEETIKQKQMECQEATALLIKLFTSHPELLQEIKGTTEGKELLNSKQKNIKTIELDPDYVQHYIIE